MKAEILKITTESLNKAYEIIKSDNLVAFPTETVYGLGANAYSTDAVRKIYQVKGRPADNPLIIHVHKDFVIEGIALIEHDYIKKLIEKYTPGPLTFVLKGKGNISKLAAANLDTVALRIPSDAGAQRFLKRVNIPIAAPSANISSHVSPVTAMHVFEDLGDKISLILDGGRCDIGIESTIIDATGPVPKILRQGAVTEKMIKEICGEVITKVPVSDKVISPGTKYRHYSPNCESILFKRNEIEKILRTYEIYTSPYILCDNEMAEHFRGKNLLLLGKNNKEAAANLYSKLREGEKKANIIIAVELKEDGDSEGVMNRLYKACKS